MRLVKEMLLVEEGNRVYLDQMNDLLLWLYAAAAFSRSPTWDRLPLTQKALTRHGIDEALKNQESLSLSAAEVKIVRFLEENAGDLESFRKQGQPYGLSPETLEAALVKANEIASAKMKIRVTTDGGRLLEIPRYIYGFDLNAYIQQRCKTRRWFGMAHDWEDVDDEEPPSQQPSDPPVGLMI